MTAPTEEFVAAAAAELSAATIRIAAAIDPVNRELHPAVSIIALVDLTAAFIGTARKLGRLTDDDVRGIAERFDLRITEARR